MQSIPHIKINSERLQADFDEISRIGLTEAKGITRLALSREDLEARAWFADQIEAAGLLIHDDDAGNLSGVLRCANSKARTIIIGSHLDTVPNAGRFDGTLGVLAGLECLRTIRESGIELPVHLEVMDFTDDEGTWLPMFGSMSLTGLLPDDVLNPADPKKSAFRAALRRAGINPDDVRRAERRPKNIAAYIELHVEQGKRLESALTSVGVVTGSVGRLACRFDFLGQSGHSGTARMAERRDALLGAAKFVTRAHEMIRSEFDEGTINCGQLEVLPGGLTIIPNEAQVTVEFRHPDEEGLSAMKAALWSLAERCAAEQDLQLKALLVSHIPASTMDAQVIEAIEQACAMQGVSQQRLVSYASHNAQVMSAFVPSGMLFIPSVNGTSHHPAELSRWDDVIDGTNVLLTAILNLALR